MSESSTQESESEQTEPTAETSTSNDVRRYANYAILLVLGLLAFVAVIRLYFSVSNVITTWITNEYRSLFQAAFNLIVVLAAGVGISYQLRRLYG
ncbi:hypothetical protein SAMN04488065_1989 [Haloplanus vescus]|uniref:DUF8060 domain-containing protein n=1 Tax=Haloplanus vescus TaxID=555874 RepID=A0A1H3YMV8_9EURY|nr:hypothetical protein [Haloplanus vescus]SEA12880.1 hypothetical protein SAMN04488065_1989 [Haloplanus vescus]